MELQLQEFAAAWPVGTQVTYWKGRTFAGVVTGITKDWYIKVKLETGRTIRVAGVSITRVVAA